MDTTGKLNFGTYNGATNVITSPAAYNDNNWHHAVVTQGSARHAAVRRRRPGCVPAP